VTLEHDPEKWTPVSEKIMLNEKIERDDDSKKSHRAPAAGRVAKRGARRRV
jgi:hypothetical protein